MKNEKLYGIITWLEEKANDHQEKADAHYPGNAMEYAMHAGEAKAFNLAAQKIRNELEG